MDKIEELQQKLDEQVDITIDLEKRLNKLIHEREHIFNLIVVDLRSIIQSLCGSISSYCIWNKKNTGDNQKIYLNLLRVLNDREQRALKLFDERLEKIKKGEL